MKPKSIVDVFSTNHAFRLTDAFFIILIIVTFLSFQNTSRPPEPSGLLSNKLTTETTIIQNENSNSEVTLSGNLEVREKLSSNQVVQRTDFIDDKGKITFATDKHYASVVKTMVDGKNVLEEYLDAEGKPVTLPGGYSAIKRTYIDGLNALEEYLDSEGKPASLSSGYSAIKREYENNLPVIITYLDSDLKPIIISSGYSTIHRSYNGNRLIDTDSYFIGDLKVNCNNGYHGYKRFYDEQNRIAAIEYLDENGKLTNTKQGYARITRTYNAANRVEFEYYYSLVPMDKSSSFILKKDEADAERLHTEDLAQGQANGHQLIPAIKSLGYFGRYREYDENGFVILQTYFDENGEPYEGSRGYATARWTYLDGKLHSVQYYDRNDLPTTAGKNQYGIEYNGEQRIYLNADGKRMLRVDNFLHNHPRIVLVFGILLTLLFTWLPSKEILSSNAHNTWIFSKLKTGLTWKNLFLLLYILFILLMTIAYRKSKESVAQFFTLYTQFFTNPSTRQDLLNNIWLFVPLGAGLNGFSAVSPSDGICLIKGRLRRNVSDKADDGKSTEVTEKAEPIMDNKRWLQPWIYGILLSILIETTQYFAGIGLCEIDDVINNGVGTLIDYYFAAGRKRCI